MHVQSWPILVRTGLLALCLLVGGASPGLATGKDLAVLVVGKSTDAAMASQERQVIEKLTQMRAQRGWNHRLLPIYSYHFDKTGERAYCEERLKVKPADLIVVGIVELENGVPVSFVYRENAVRSAEKCAEQIMDRARSEMVARGLTPAAARPSPSAMRTPSASPPVRRTSASPPVRTPSASPRVRTTSATPRVRTPSASPPARTTPVAVSTPPPIPPAVRPATSPTRSPARPPAPGTPVAVQTPSTPRTAAPAANEKWAIQVGIVSTLEKARALVGKMKDEHKDLRLFEIRKGWKDGKVIFRVLVGIFHGQADAFARCKELKEAGVDCFSVKIEPSLGQVVH